MIDIENMPDLQTSGGLGIATLFSLSSTQWLKGEV